MSMSSQLRQHCNTLIQPLIRCKYRLSRVKQRNSHRSQLDMLTTNHGRALPHTARHVSAEHNSSLVFNNILLTPASPGQKPRYSTPVQIKDSNCWESKYITISHGSYHIQGIEILTVHSHSTTTVSLGKVCLFKLDNTLRPGREEYIQHHVQRGNNIQTFRLNLHINITP